MRASVLMTCALALPLLGMPATAQLQPGQFVATVIATSGGAPSFGEMYIGDTTTRTVTQLTIGPQLRVDRVNAVVMTSPSAGYVSTVPFAGSGNIHAISIAGSVVSDSQLNATPLPGYEPSQLVVRGNEIYFTSRTVAGPAGYLSKLSTAGGQPVQLVDFSTVTGFAGAPVNALAIYGSFAYVGTNDASTAPNLSQIWEVDLTNPTNVVLVGNLPRSRTSTIGQNIGVQNLQFSTVVPSFLLVQGVGGDILVYEVLTHTLLSHLVAAPRTTPPTNNLLSSFVMDPISEDLLMGTINDGAVDLFVQDHHAERVITGLGSGTINNTVTGIWYLPFTGTGSYKAFDPGCPGASGFVPTSFGLGVPVANTSTFGFGLASGTPGTPALLFVGRSHTSWNGVPLPFDLTPVGLRGCFLRTGPILTLSAVLAGSGAGNGQAVIPFPLAANLSGIQGFTQWLTITPTFALDATSDGREFVIQ